MLQWLDNQWKVNEFINEVRHLQSIDPKSPQFKESEMFPGLIFWNPTGSENRPDFATVYINKSQWKIYWRFMEKKKVAK